MSKAELLVQELRACLNKLEQTVDGGSQNVAHSTIRTTCEEAGDDPASWREHDRVVRSTSMSKHEDEGAESDDDSDEDEPEIGDEAEDAIAKANDPVEVLLDPTAFVADFRVHANPRAVEYLAGPEGAPKLHPEVVACVEQTFLYVPFGSGVKCKLSDEKAFSNLSELVESFTIIIDLRLTEKAGPRSRKRVFPLLSFGHEFTEPQLVVTADSRLVLTMETRKEQRRRSSLFPSTPTTPSTSKASDLDPHASLKSLRTRMASVVSVDVENAAGGGSLRETRVGARASDVDWKARSPARRVSVLSTEECEANKNETEATTGNPSPEKKAVMWPPFLEANSEDGEGARPPEPTNPSWTRRTVQTNKWHRVSLTVSAEERWAQVWLDGKQQQQMTFGTVAMMQRLKVLSKGVQLLGGRSEELLEAQVRRVEVHPRAMEPAELERRAQLPLLPEDVINLIGASARERVHKLSLNRVVPRTVPVWHHASFHALFCDRFEAQLAGVGAHLHESLMVFLHLANKVVQSPSGLLSPQHRAVLAAVLRDLAVSKVLATRIHRASEQNSPDALIGVLKLLHRLLAELQPGASLFVPVGCKTEESVDHVMLVVTNLDNDTFTVTVVTLGAGLGRHPVSPSACPSKYKYHTAIPLERVRRSKVLDMAWWLVVLLRRCTAHASNTLDALYSLLGCLKDESLDTTVNALLKLPTSDPAARWWRDWRSQISSDSAFSRIVSESVYQEGRRRRVTREGMKAFALEFRKQAMFCVRNDMMLVRALGHAERLTVRIGVQQTCFATLKQAEAMAARDGHRESAKKLLEHVLPDTEKLLADMALKENTDEYNSLPPAVVDLKAGDDGWPVDKAARFPFFEVFWHDKDDTAGMGGAMTGHSILPVNSIHEVQRVKSFSDCILTVRRMRRVLTELHCYKDAVRHYHWQVILIVEHLFTHTFPVPLGPRSSQSLSCLWKPDAILFAEQKEVLLLLNSFTRHYVAAYNNLYRDTWNHPCMITVLAALFTMCDAILRLPSKDWSETHGGVTSALLAGGFGVDAQLFIKQTEASPMMSTAILRTRAAVLDYFAELEASGKTQHKIWSWELDGYSMSPQTQHHHVISEFAKQVMGDLRLGVDPLQFAYSQVPQTKELFPEFELFRDMAFWWKWSMCPMCRNDAVGGDVYSLVLQYKLQNKIGVSTAAGQTLLPIRGQMPATSQRFKQHAHPNTVMMNLPDGKGDNASLYSEDDVLHRDELPKFNGTVSPRDAELLLSYLTVPYLRIPLLLRFFAGEDRVHALKERAIQQLLEHSLAEPGAYLPRLDLLDEGACLPAEVPTRQPELIATSHGLLLNEMQRSPEGILQPLKELLEWALDAAASTIDDSESLKIVLFVTKLVSRTVAFARDLLRCWKGEVVGFELWAHSLEPAPEDRIMLERLSSELHRMLLPDAQQPAQPGGKAMRDKLMERLEEIQRKCPGLYCAFRGKKTSTRKRIEDKELLQYIHTSNDIHAHLLLIYINCETFDAGSCMASLSSLFYILSHHTWNQGKTDIACSEVELFHTAHKVRMKCSEFLQHAAEHDLAAFVDVCQFVYKANVGRDNPHNAWRRVTNREGRFVCLKANDVALDGPVGFVSERNDFVVEIDLHNLELRIAGNCLKALDDDIAGHPDFQTLIGDNTLTLQCLVKEDRAECKERDVIGLETPLNICMWQSGKDVDNFTRESYYRDYIPGEPADGEEWLQDLFEPIRRALFEDEKTKIEFVLPGSSYGPDTVVAMMVGKHPQNKGNWFEVVLVQEHRVISVFAVVDHGGRFRRTFIYTNNVLLAYQFRQPALEVENAWPPWGRHAAGSPMPERTGPACVIRRSIPSSARSRKEPAESDCNREQYVPPRFLCGLIPKAACRGLVFWQDEDDCSIIRGYAQDISLPQVDATVHSVSIKLTRTEDDDVASVFATVTRYDVSVGTDEVLLNFLHAPPRTALTSVVKTLCRAEHCSNLLVWAREGAASFDTVRLTRLNMTFKARTIRDPRNNPKQILASEEFPHMHLGDLASPAIRFLDGVPQYIPVCSAEQDWVICVPNVSFTRPELKDRPFSTELVLEPYNLTWQRYCHVKYFSLKLHASGSSILPSGLSSTLYLFILKMLHRDYEEACGMMGGISCDASLSAQEEAIFKLLHQAASDTHPNAHACRVKITLAFADCPVRLPWDLRSEAAAYFSKLRHVSAGCRLSLEEEQSLIADCKTFDKVQQVWDQAPRFYDEQKMTEWYHCLVDDATRRSAHSQAIRQAEEFYAAMAEMARVKTGVFSHKERHLQHLLYTLKKHRIDQMAWMLLLNRDKLLHAKGRHLQAVSCQFPPRLRVLSAWQQHWNDAAISEEPKASALESVRCSVSGANRLFQPDGDRRASKLGRREMFRLMQEHALLKPRMTMEVFLRLYSILSGEIELKAAEMSAHSFAAMLFYSTEDCCKGGYLASILHILCSNEALWLARRSELPQIESFKFREPSEADSDDIGDADDAHELAGADAEELGQLGPSEAARKVVDPFLKAGAERWQRDVPQEFLDQFKSMMASHLEQMHNAGHPQCPRYRHKLLNFGTTRAGGACWMSEQGMCVSDDVDDKASQNRYGCGRPECSDGDAEIWICEECYLKLGGQPQEVQKEEKERMHGAMAFLRAVHQFLVQHQGEFKAEPPARKSLPERAVQDVAMPQPSVLDDCPSLTVRDLNQQFRSFQCHVSSWTSILLRGAEKFSEIRGYHRGRLESLCDRPLLAVCCPEKEVSKVDPESQSVTLPFDPGPLKRNATSYGGKIIKRFEDQAQQLAQMEGNTPTFELKGFETSECDKEGGWERARVQERVQVVKQIMSNIRAQKETDLALFREIESCLEGLINTSHATPNNALSIMELEHKVLQISGHRPRVSFRFLVLTLLSTDANEWQRVNPTISDEVYRHGLDLLAIGLLHGTRIASAIQALGELQSLLKIVEPLEAAPPDPAARTVIKQKAALVASLLSAQRTYVRANDEYNPHFLVFEFLRELFLRTRQVEIVEDIRASLQQLPPRSVVQQMIMGAGKTTVVSPLLALLFSEPKKLVLQVVPPALLEFSRGVMRSALGSTLGLHVYTFSFSRSDGVDGRLCSKLSRAAQEGAVVMTTPTALKSLMLKFIENLTDIKHGRPQKREKIRQVKDATKVFDLLQDAVVVYDEVDTVLDPLKSELNFPCGTKDPLSMSPERWQLPLFLLECFLRARDDRMLEDVPLIEKKAVVGIHAELREGLKHGMLQRSPHWILLSREFYTDKLMLHFVDLSLQWCYRQGLAQNFEWMKEFVTRQDEVDPDPAEDINCQFLQRPEWEKQLLNLVRSWIHIVLPHVLGKVDRVSFGLMTKADAARARQLDPLTPRSRLDLAIPFVGKDCPSDASEFAHPDVTIGLTILAYRYEGLRLDDFQQLLRAMLESLSKELGEINRRPSALKYASWVHGAGGVVMARGEQGDDGAAGHAEQDRAAKYVLPLHSLQRANKTQVDKVFQLLRLERSTIHHFLDHFTFPRYMRYHSAKYSASAQELGSDMLFSRRVGFSGTPSSLIPKDLGECVFEPGSEARILRTLTSAIADIVDIPDSTWKPESVLDMVAGGPYHALIDTGALITGYTNLEVAQYLLDAFRRLRPAGSVEGVVYLNESDRKMILVDSTRHSVELAECGIALENRFTFYDQVHTVGMDIKHCPNAQAAVTLGKDMVFRDLAQGVYRMRGIESGQSMSYFVTPEVRQLVLREMERIHTSSKTALTPADYVVWLILSSMRHEQVQANQLLLQNFGNIYRKVAFKELVQKSSLLCNAMQTPSFHQSLDMFTEQVSHEIPKGVHKPMTLKDRVDAIDAKYRPILEHDGADDDCENQRLKFAHEIEEVASQKVSAGLDVEAEQEQEQEQEQQQEKEQEIEIEKVADLQYARADEQQDSWEFRSLLDVREGRMDPFYAMKEFNLFGRMPLQFPNFLAASNNYYKISWVGERRIKNVCMILDVVPNESLFEEVGPAPAAPRDGIAAHVAQAESALWGIASSSCMQCEQGSVKLDHVKALVKYMTGQDSPGHRTDERAWLTEQMVDDAVTRVLKVTNQEEQQSVRLETAHFRDLVSHPTVRHTHNGRFFVALSLAEAETVRRILHLRGKHRPVIDGGRAHMALRNLAHFSKPVDVSCNYHPPPLYQTQRAQQLLRFFDGELCYTFAQQLMVLYSMVYNFTFERQVFFETVIARRRRQQLQSEDAPVTTMFKYQSEGELAFTNCLRQLFGKALKQRHMRIDAAFDFFDTNKDAELNAEETFAMLEWMGFRDVTARQVLRFFKHADLDSNETISLDEFKQFLYITDVAQIEDTMIDPPDPDDAPAPKGAVELKAEREAMDEERVAHKQEVARLREEQEATVRKAACQWCGGRSEASSEPAKPNPDLTSPDKVRWEYTDGTHPQHMLAALSGCAQFENDPDGELKYSDVKDAMKPFKHFLRLEAKSQIKFTLPDHIIAQGSKQQEKPRAGSAPEGGIAEYSISVSFRLTQRPAMKCPLLILGSGVAVFVYNSGRIEVQTPSTFGDSEEDDPAGLLDDAAEKDAGSKVKKVPVVGQNKWSVLTVAANAEERTLRVVLDGQQLPELTDVDLPRMQSESSFNLFGQGKRKGLQLQVVADVKFVQFNLGQLSLAQALEIQVPMGVWRCQCQRRNGPQYKHCGQCGAKKKLSAPRPKGDTDPAHPGLTVVVEESFAEIVLEGTRTGKDVFVDLTADWCGPSRAMQPEWHYLANLLKNHPSIVIATMDSDANEVDRGYFPETYIPNLKLFLKGDKPRCVNYPDGYKREVADFVRFLQERTGLDFHEFAQQRLPEYLKAKNVDALVQAAQAALARHLRMLRQRRLAAPENQGNDPAAVVTELVDGLDVFRFLAHYFSDPAAFRRDGDAEDSRTGEDIAHDCRKELSDFPHVCDRVAQLVSMVRGAVELALQEAMPEDPAQFLGKRLSQRPVTSPTAKSSAVQIASEADFHTMYNKARSAVLADDARALAEQLQAGLPARAELGRQSLMCLAAAHDSEKMLLVLSEFGGDLNEQMPHGKVVVSALEVAAMHGCTAAARFLLNSGVPFRNALQYAVSGGYCDIVRMLLFVYGANPDIRTNGRSAVTLAVHGNQEAVLHDLLAVSNRVDAPLDRELCKRLNLAPNSNLLHVAAKFHHIDIMKAIQTTAPQLAQQRNDFKETPVDVAHIAVKPYLDAHFLESLELLRGCAIGAENGGAGTAEALRQLFKDKAANANAQDVRGWSALMAAALAKDVEACTVLLDNGAKFSTQNRSGQTALFWAHAAEASEVCKLLVARGAQLASREEEGLERLRELQRSGGDEIKSLLTVRCERAMPLMRPAQGGDSGFYKSIVERMSMETLARLQMTIPKLLPANYAPAITLEQSILNFDAPRIGLPVMEAWDCQVPGDSEFKNWKSLVEHSKVFVQERVAWGDPLPPASIFALHLYTIPCNLFRLCNRAMREDNKEGLKKFHVFIWYLWNALQAMGVKPSTVFRGIGANPRNILASIKNGIMQWPAFSSTSASRFVASSFIRRSGRGGVVFKIKAKNCRDIKAYSYKPMEEELLLPPLSWFMVKGVYAATDYNMKWGLGAAAAELSSVSMVPMRERDQSEITESEVILIVLQEVDESSL